MSAHLAIQQYIVAALAAAPLLTDGGVTANSLDPLPQETDSQIVVRFLGTQAPAQQILGGPYDWATQYAVECSARVPQGQDPHAVVRPLYEAVWARVATMVPPVSLGVMQVNQAPSFNLEVERLDTLVATSTLRLVVLHRTDSISLEAA